MDPLVSKVLEGNLTQGVLATFIAEISAIINNRPNIGVSFNRSCNILNSGSSNITHTENIGRKCCKEPRRVRR